MHQLRSGCVCLSQCVVLRTTLRLAQGERWRTEECRQSGWLRVNPFNEGGILRGKRLAATLVRWLQGWSDPHAPHSIQK